MEFLSRDEFESVDDGSYMIRNSSRWDYFKEVIKQIKIIDNFDKINKTLELGPYKTPLIKNGDIMDINNYSDGCAIEVGDFFQHDASIVPYPFKDKEYDLIIACQVLEHLKTNQKEVIKEFNRISKRVIITLPYKWFRPCDMHHMIDEKVIDYWANGLNYSYEEIMGGGGEEVRILRIYELNDSNLFKIPFYLKKDLDSSNLENKKLKKIITNKNNHIKNLKEKNSKQNEKLKKYKSRKVVKYVDKLKKII
ncbi:MAG: class I SAM-dependent methyltransferase [Methanobrevibacter sp.]|nr:class I SAM-dependent methyltransferase [Candidatus Methanoflexus mossambicus]